jgi:hypothetical protein
MTRNTIKRNKVNLSVQTRRNTNRSRVIKNKKPNLSHDRDSQLNTDIQLIPVIDPKIIQAIQEKTRRISIPERVLEEDWVTRIGKRYN